MMNNALPERNPGTHYPFAVTPEDPLPLDELIEMVHTVRRWAAADSLGRHVKLYPISLPLRSGPGSI